MTIAQFNGKDVPADVAPLFTPFKLGELELKHRIVYPPLTRCRATGCVPQPLAVEYYSQRATAGGLMICEATCISPEAHGYPQTPGIYTKEQIEGWKPIAKAIHDKGAYFYCQLWHCGRASHRDYQPDGRPPPAPSAIAPKGQCFTPSFEAKDYETPREMTIEEIKALPGTYVQCAKNALEAGFDGVEVHAGNGYLLDEFQKDTTNKRTDEYGGSVEKRCRLTLEVVDAVVAAVGAKKVGIRLTPFITFLDGIDTKPYETFSYLSTELDKRGLAYIHFVEPRADGNEDVETKESLDPFRALIKNTPFIAAGGYKTADAGAKAVASGHADLVAYGRVYLANPDLPKRFTIPGAKLNDYDRNTFYGAPDPKLGYTDYPFLE
ncbi:unnamed protein product [Pedinophyceae sp. YPF-701]|nr:unnamed protein product [Pedinophyceae sp. YPF-701]